jgi:hypothetical protein
MIHTETTFPRLSGEVHEPSPSRALCLPASIAARQSWQSPSTLPRSAPSLCADRPFRLQVDVPHTFKMFATVAITDGPFASMALLSGLLCCAGPSQDSCKEVAAKAHALYSPGHPCSVLGLSTYDLDVISPEEVMLAYKRSIKLAHPDKGGSAASMHILEIAQRVLLDARWREAYRRRGWAGVHAAWKKAGCSQASSFGAEAPSAQTRPNFVGVALHDGRVIVVPVTALELVGDDDDRELFESPYWLLLAPGVSREATHVDEFLQAPAELWQPCDTGPPASAVSNSGACSVNHARLLVARSMWRSPCPCGCHVR